MSDVLILIFNTFWQFFVFLDNLYLINGLSVLRLLLILLLFTIAFKFLFPHNKGGD